MFQTRFAVLIRTNKANEKTIELIKSLERSRFFDLFVFADETDGVLEFDSANKITHRLPTVCSEIEYINNLKEMMLRSDALFTFIKRRLPNYDYYIMIEDDVYFTSHSSSMIDRLIGHISMPHQKPDLISTWCRDIGSPNDYDYWGERCFRTFGACSAIFFPFVCLSSRAIDYLDYIRRKEYDKRSHADYMISRELFVPTALRLAGGYTIKDINDIVPDAYSPDTFKIGLPWMLGDHELIRDDIAMMHPVYDIDRGLSKHYDHAISTGQLNRFLKNLMTTGRSLGDPTVSNFAIKALIELTTRAADT